MSLKVKEISRLNPWERNYCPVCGGQDFVSIHNASVWCEKCNAQFVVRHTAGDPGYVLDCYTKDVYLEYSSQINIPDGYLWLVDKEGDYRSGWIYLDENRKMIHLNDKKKESLVSQLKAKSA